MPRSGKIMVKPKNKETFSPLLVGEVCNLAGAECLIIVKPKNKETFSPLLVGEVCNLAGAECLINSKLYYK